MEMIENLSNNELIGMLKSCLEERKRLLAAGAKEEDIIKSTVGLSIVFLKTYLKEERNIILM